MTDELRIVIGHPSRLVRSVLATSLARRGLPAVSSVGLVSMVARECIEGRADVVVTADEFPDGGLLSALSSILSSGARVLVLGRQGADCSDLLLAGASGCLFVDDAAPSEVAHGVRTVCAGQASLHPVAALAVLSRWRAERTLGDGSSPEVAGRERVGPSEGLTAREQDVLHAMAEGLSARGIAERLGISAKTVEAHKARVYSKLGARNNAHAVSVAVARGLLSAESGRDR